MAAYIRTILFFLCVIFVTFLPGHALKAGSAQSERPLRILNITPDGDDVPAGKKIVFQFNRAVVPVGAMDRKAPEIPITINPEVKGSWRWINTSTLACILDENSPLKSATRYEIVVNPGIMTEDGVTLKEPVKHSFITERPKVVHSWFRTWESPSLPVIRITFNQPVLKSSVEEHLFIQAGWQKENRTNVKAEPDEKDRETPVFLPLPGERMVLVTHNPNKEPEKVKASAPPKKSIFARIFHSIAAFFRGKSPEEKTNIHDNSRMEARRVWLISPEKELPENASVSLRVEPGLVSALGPERGVGNRELLAFATFPGFSFDGIECFDNNNKRISFIPGSDPAGRNLCNPVRSVMLAFSSPVINSEIKKNVKFEPSLSDEEQGYNPWDNVRDYSMLNTPYKKYRKYYSYLPRVLRADQVYHVSSRHDLRDEFGRTLKVPIDISFATDHRPPDYELTNKISVLEKNADTDMPVVVTNLEKFTMSYDRLTSEKHDVLLHRELILPDKKDVAMKIPMKVREMLEGESGVVSGSVDTRPHIRKWGEANMFFAEVTPFEVHVKIGHFNTLVWVTDLTTGEPVEGADVCIYQALPRTLPESPECMTRGTTDSDGIVSLAGLEELDPDVTNIYGYGRNRKIFFTKVEKGKDLALLPMDYNFLMNSYSASNYTVSSVSRKQYGYIRSWGTTAQGVYKAGDNIQYKIYVRNQDNEKIIPAPKKDYALRVIDSMNKTVHEVNDIELSGFGAFDGEFTVPETGSVGWYRFVLSASFTKETWEPMSVLVSDFTPSPFSVTTDINGIDFQPGEKIDITTRARLHGGGPYTDASARVTVTLRKRNFSSDDPAARGFLFDSNTPDTRNVQTLVQKEGTIDDRGNLVMNLQVPESSIYYGRLEVESAVRDDRGKYISGRSFANYSSRDIFAGLRSDSWIYREGEPADLEALVVDIHGKPVAGIPVSIKVEHRETTASRVKGAGNAYLTQLNTRWVEDEKQVIESGEKPVAYTFTPENTGLYRITALIRDSKGRENSTELTKWVAGKGMVLWEDNHNNSLDIVPEKNKYRVGETARYLVKNPFPGAKALITVERYGILKHWVQTLDTATPVIEFRIERNFIPGYYLSVVVMSPRVEAPPGDGDVDLGKPAFRMGYVRGDVSDTGKQLSIDVRPEREDLKPGEKIGISLHASYQDNSPEEPVEFAVAVLDEAVLDLLRGGSSYFDPYKGFYELENLDMLNYSLIMQLVGRQKFEKKGADPAGDGGGDLGLRTLFKFVSYWNPSLKADEKGNAKIEFVVPDNLTGWRVLAMAVTPGDRMGLGEGRFNVNRPTEIRPVMPNQVTEGDSFEAGFSVMNRTGKERELEITITAKGAIETEDGTGRKETTQRVNVKPYKRITLWMPIKSKGSGKIGFTARGGDSTDRDGTVYELDVHAMTSLETAATYGTTDSDTITELIIFPKDIRTDAGGVFVNLSPTVIGNLEGAFKYLRDYPYTCWEQKITRAVMASHFINLKKYMPGDFDWEDAPEIPDAMLALAANYQTPGGGMSYYVPYDRFASPYLSAYTAMAFNWLRERGYNVPASVENRLHEYLETMLRKDVAPDFYSRGMASTVRAVALAALAQNNRIILDDLSRYYPYVGEMDTFGKAHFLIAASLINGAEDMRRSVFNMIMSHAEQTGGKFIINDTFDDGYSRILSSSLRTNAAVLSAFLAYGKTEQGKVLTKDIPFRMVRYITRTRKQSGRWENTQENIFCMNALVEYSKAYESAEPDMTITALIGDDLLGKAAFKDRTDSPVSLRKGLEKNDPGRHTQARIIKDGTGRYYYSAGISYAPEQVREDNINAGIDIRREYSVERNGNWVLLKSPMKIGRGELVRVDLYVSIPAARNFLVVDDPVPGGLEPVNRDLATASTVDADKAKSDYAADSWFFHYGEWSWYGMSRWSFYHKELRHNAARFYSEYLPAGNYHLSYTAQAIASGEFTVMPAHSEEMYDPDVFGKSAPAMLDVEK